MTTSSAVKRRSGGHRTNHFRTQLTELDQHIRTAKKIGRKKYLDKEDLRWAFDRTKGHCSFCDFPLNIKGAEEGKPHFKFLRPLKVGGAVEKDNLLVICYKCKYNHQEARRDKPRELIYDFNTIPDLIQRLVEEVIELSKCDDEYVRLYQDNVKRIKRELNFAIGEFVHHLAYNPRSDATDIAFERRIAEQNTAADAIAKMAKAKELEELRPLREQLVNILKEINATRKYSILRF